MGGICSKDGKMRYVNNSSEKDYGRSKIMSEMVCERKKESAAYERAMMVFAVKESEWKQEKKKMRGELKMLRKMVEEKDERIKGIEDHNGENWEVVLGREQISGAAKLLAEQIREERAKRDETVEKWKQLYMAIKMELDDLIQRTHSGNGLYWRAEEEDITVEELKRELKAKEEMIAGLNSKIVSLENEQYKREREIDILRQSLRIMSSKKTVSRDSHLVKRQSKKL